MSETWKERSLRHKDQQAREDLGEEESAKLPAKKDTKTWCKGKVGRFHQEQVFPRRTYEKISRLELCCKNCGKVLETFWLNFHHKVKPEWVVEWIKNNPIR